MAPLISTVASNTKDISAAAMVNLRKAPRLPSDGVMLMMRAGMTMDSAGEDIRRGGLFCTKQFTSRLMATTTSIVLTCKIKIICTGLCLMTVTTIYYKNFSHQFVLPFIPK